MPAFMIVTTAQLYKVAYGKFAVGAYNINNAEQTMGLFRGCIESEAPFIIQLSKGARKYTDKRRRFFQMRSSQCISTMATSRLATTASTPDFTAR
jgi:fructose-bisphosphate aldolase class II